MKPIVSFYATILFVNPFVIFDESDECYQLSLKIRHGENFRALSLNSFFL